MAIDLFTDEQLKPLSNTEYFKVYVFNYHLKNHTAVVKIAWAAYRVRSLTVIMVQNIKNLWKKCTEKIGSIGLYDK
jgi:hypothetical protein